MRVTQVKCSVCGKSVSNDVAVADKLVVRAYVECPECAERHTDRGEPESKHVKLERGKTARVLELDTKYLLEIHGPALIDKKRYKIISFHNTKTAHHWGCHLADDIGMCQHKDRAQDMFCNRQNCPWHDRRQNDTWWEGHPGNYEPPGPKE